MISTSPLRYPGGKTRFAKFLWEAILSSGEKTEVFVEPFCGGAGAAIALLESGKVNRISLNDIDPLIASFWQVVFGKTIKTREDINWLIHSIEKADFSIDEWRRQKVLKPINKREAAWKCLYLNRTSFNGILHKSGPIGGWEQKKRTLDVRFNREKIINRINELYCYRDRVEHADCMHWQLFCTRYRNSKRAYLYLDPPYYYRAEQLYGYLFNEKEHRLMRNYLVKLPTPWILSYDDAHEVRKLYSTLKGIDARVVDQTYSTHPMGGASFIGRELVFTNRTFPAIIEQREPKIHVGMTVIGKLEAWKLQTQGPIRTPTSQSIIIKQ